MTTKLLCEAVDEDALFSQNIHGDTPIHTAARRGNAQSLSVMLKFCHSKTPKLLGPLLDTRNHKRKIAVEVTSSDMCREVLLDAADLAANLDRIGAAAVFGMKSNRLPHMRDVPDRASWTSAPALQAAVLT